MASRRKHQQPQSGRDPKVVAEDTTTWLLQSPANALRILEAKADLESEPQSVDRCRDDASGRSSAS